MMLALTAMLAMTTLMNMKTLTIRQVPDDVHEALRIKAAEAGRSMEEEVRRLIEAHAAMKPKPDFTRLHALRARIKKSLPADAPSAAEMVREMRNEDMAATEAKWARSEAGLRGDKKSRKKSAS